MRPSLSEITIVDTGKSDKHYSTVRVSRRMVSSDQRGLCSFPVQNRQLLERNDAAEENPDSAVHHHLVSLTLA